MSLLRLIKSFSINFLNDRRLDIWSTFIKANDLEVQPRFSRYSMKRKVSFSQKGP